MATEILVKVYADGTGDYTSVRAAVIAEVVDLVAIDSYIVFELKGDLRNTDAFTDFNGYTTDATRNIIIRPVSGGETDGVAGSSGTIYGNNTFILVLRSRYVSIDGLEFDGWADEFFQASNLIVENCMFHDGVDVCTTSGASFSNVIAYNVSNNAFSSCDCDRVTGTNKSAHSVSLDSLFRGAGVIINCAATNENASDFNYSSATNVLNDFNASDDTSARGSNPQIIGQADFVDYANNNYNIDSASPFFSLGVGAVLAPADSGILLTVDQINQLQTIDQITLTEHSVISIGGLSQEQTADQVTLQQNGTLTVNNLQQIQTIDQVNLTQAHIVSVNDLSQFQNIDQVSLNQGNVLAVNNTDQLQTIDQVTTSTAGAVVINNASQVQSLEQLVLSIAGTVAINSLSQSQLLEQLNLTQAHVVSVDNLSQAQLLQSINFNGVVVGYLQGALTIVSAYNGQIKLTNPLTGEIRIL